MIRAVTILCAALVCLAGTAFAQTGGTIALAGTPDGSSCSIADTGPGVVEVQVLVLDATGVAGIQFAAPRPDCWAGATWLYDTVPVGLTIGDTQDPELGLSVAFGACLDAPILVGSMTFAVSGQAAPCCEYPVIKATGDLYPEINGPIVAVCPMPLHVEGVTASALINPTPDCTCQQIVPVHESTWGAIKALYN